MDVQTLLAERQRIAERLNSTRTCLGILRAQFIGCLTEEAREHLLYAMEEEAEVCRELAGTLLQVEEMILMLRIERSEETDEVEIQNDARSEFQNDAREGQRSR
jgi:hypothetical protein